MKFIIVVILAFTLQGCLSTRRSIGFNRGYKAYEKAIKRGYVKNGYFVGYMNGFLFGKSMDDLEKSIKETNEYFKNWNSERSKRRKEMDLEFKKTLDDFENYLKK